MHRRSQASSRLTVGTPDANGKVANSQGSVIYRALVGDVSVRASVTDVRTADTLADYGGELGAEQVAQITDRSNGASGNDAATVEPYPFRYAIPCAPTGSATVGSICSLSSSFNAILPGSVVEGKRAVWELGDLRVFDGGDDGLAATLGDNTLFERQGIFVP